MAKLERRVNEDFSRLLQRINDGILNGSVSAITSGGSQAMFFKMNTLGEEAFLDKLRELVG
mgnify:CR=1 FL=1